MNILKSLTVIHSKSEKVRGTAFSVKKYCVRSAGHFWAILGHSWAILGIFGPFWVIFVPLWVIFGPFRGIFGKNCGKLKIFAAPLGSRDSLLECMYIGKTATKAKSWCPQTGSPPHLTQLVRNNHCIGFPWRRPFSLNVRRRNNDPSLKSFVSANSLYKTRQHQNLKCIISFQNCVCVYGNAAKLRIRQIYFQK